MSCLLFKQACSKHDENTLHIGFSHFISFCSSFPSFTLRRQHSGWNVLIQFSIALIWSYFSMFWNDIGDVAIIIHLFALFHTLFVCVCFSATRGSSMRLDWKTTIAMVLSESDSCPGKCAIGKWRHMRLSTVYFIQSEWMKTNRTEANGIFNVFLSQTKIVRSTLRIAIDTLISLFSQWSLTSNEAIKIWTKLASKRHTCQSICLQTKSRTFLACKICIFVVYLWIV